jgi:pimeloyl-ACP methyl ester carboxylesterase
MSRRVTTLVAAVAVLALVAVAVLAGLLALRTDDGAGPVGSSDPTPVEPRTDEEATSAPEQGLQRFYAQEPAWTPCEGSFECAGLEVPVDYADPEGETIEIALLRVPASGKRVGSLVVNPGGPGAPGTDYAASADRVFRRPLLEHFDVVGFDPRGTGDSSPVDCLTDAQMDDYLAADPDPDDPQEAAAFARDVRALGRGCVRRTGDLVNHVTTVEAARDMDVLRAALGERSLTYFGASYGTKLGATYAELFPRRVGRFVLDGAVDVSLDNRELTLGQARGFETALSAYVQDCLDTSDSCFLGSTVDEGLGTIRDLLDQVDREPLPTSTDRRLRVGNAFYGVVTPLYNRDYWYILSGALKQAIDGDGSALLQLADLYSSRGPDGYTDNSAEAIFAINCLDDSSSIPFSQVEQEYDDFAAASPTFGRVFAWSLTGCRGLQAESTVEAPEIRAEGAAPIVVIGTTRDPATPYAWAEGLADQLESGVLLSRDGDGHTGYNSGNECVDRAVESYLVEGAVPDDGTEC